MRPSGGVFCNIKAFRRWTGVGHGVSVIGCRSDKWRYRWVAHGHSSHDLVFGLVVPELARRRGGFGFAGMAARPFGVVGVSAVLPSGMGGGAGQKADGLQHCA